MMAAFLIYVGRQHWYSLRRSRGHQPRWSSCSPAAHTAGLRFWMQRKFHLCLFLAGLLLAGTAAHAAANFTAQERLGYNVGDQWEPATAADGFGHVYLLYPQYGVVPGCPTCPSPSMILQVSNDRGLTWSAPRIIAPAGDGQYDPQIVVDPLDHRTVYASWLQNSKSNTVVAKSSDSGQTWSLVVANRIANGVDKDVLAVRGNDVYVAYSQGPRLWVSASHNGGQTFSASSLNNNPRLRWLTAGGAAIDPAGNVYFAWAGYKQREGINGPVSLYLSKSSDGGATWQTSLFDSSAAPPGCAGHKCGWAFLGAQMTIASDAGGTLYALWNAGHASGGPERIYFASSTTAGASWSPRQDVSAAPLGVEHSFPALVAGTAGDVRVAWMDTRSAPYWNIFYRSSTNGGASWSEEMRMNSFVAGYSYISSAGFSFPFGDYFQMAIDDLGRTHVVWGEGLNWNTPGSIWYARGR